MDAVERFESRVRKSLSEYGLAAESSVLCAFSGGPDSSALALSLSRLKDEFGFSLELAYVDHGLRPLPEIRAEIELVRAFSASIGCKVQVSELGRGAVEDYARRGKCGIEAAARDLRYRALAFLMRDSGETVLALGHTLSDQAETMMARFFSGSGIRGLRGMKDSGPREIDLGQDGGKRSFTIMRPLLDLVKSDVIAYLAAMGRSWSVDTTNDESLYLRNRLRHELLPRVIQLFPGYVKSLSALRGKLLRIESFLDEAAQGLFKKEEASWLADAHAFYESHDALRQHAIEKALADLARGRRVPFGFIEKCVEARKNLEELRRFPVKGCGFVLAVRGESIILEERLAHTPKKGYFFNIHGFGRYGAREGLEFDLYESESEETGPDLASFSFPIVLRSVRPADKIAIRGGTKLVNDLFGEWGVPEQAKSAIPLLEDGRGLICVLGRPFGYRNRFAERGFKAASGDARYLAVKVTAKGGMNGR